MKQYIPILVCVFILSACQKSKQMIVEDLIEAKNCFEKEKVNQILSSCAFYEVGRKRHRKDQSLQRLER